LFNQMDAVQDDTGIRKDGKPSDAHFSGRRKKPESGATEDSSCEWCEGKAVPSFRLGEMKGDENVPVQQNDPYAKQKKSGSQGMADDIQHEFLVIPDFPVRQP
ncbi:hypothetical protein, partial [Akkermansia sp.]